MAIKEEENFSTRKEGLRTMVDMINPNISAITLHVNGLNSLIKRQRLSHGIFKSFRRHLKNKEIKV